MIKIVQIMLNVVYIFVMNLPFYTDVAYIPSSEGEVIAQYYQRSAFERMEGFPSILALGLIVIAISFVSSICSLIFKNNKRIEKVSQVASIVAIFEFILIMSIAFHQTMNY